jgi:SAM-dependent methyltransferase
MSMPRILDVGCARGKHPGAIGIDISADTQADVLCDWNRTYPFAASQFDEVRLVHVIEEVDDILATLREVHRVARPGARVVIVTPHYSDHSSYISPTHRWHLSSFSLWFFGEKPGVYDYYAPAHFRLVRLHVRLLQLWRWLGFELLVNSFTRFRRFWENYLCFVVRGKNITWELEVLK